jgi:hypothetical protein
LCDDDGHCETSCLLNSSEKGGVEELPHDYSILKAERSTSHRKRHTREYENIRPNGTRLRLRRQKKQIHCVIFGLCVMDMLATQDKHLGRALKHDF